MWGKYKVSQQRGRDVWEKVVISGVPFVDKDCATKIVQKVLALCKDPAPSEVVNEILALWGSKSKKSGYYGFKTYIESFNEEEEDNPFKKVTKNSKLTPDLQKAVLNNDYNTVRELLLKGADPNIRQGEEDSILYQALNHPNPHVIKLLLQAGADQNYAHRDYGCHHSTNTTCFQRVVEKSGGKQDNSNLLALFLKYGGDPNKETRNSFGGMRSDGAVRFTPLHTAIKQSNESAVLSLLEVGADSSIYYCKVYDNEYGYRENSKIPCITLAYQSVKDPVVKMKIMKMLLQYGADVNQRYHFLKEIKVSEPSGDDPRDDDYQSGLSHLLCFATTLHLAITDNNIEIIQFLVMSGADTNISLIEGKEKIPVTALAKSQEAIYALGCEFQPLHFKILPKDVQHYIEHLLILQSKLIPPLPKDINYLLFTWLIKIYWFKKNTKQAINSLKY
eukprot:TRINITY_DN25078_c0_g1_i1.p1 TRINITY_DN25078_c0_g1~~TRINITY_DN25078_c0_g1_i1.p1  ORF type:complete len:457 (-),score=133.04 TRINITY_DN25078_c0_g1_i1:80-1420(-)